MITTLTDRDRRGDWLETPREIDEQGWAVHRCAQHDYLGVPTACPYPQCENGHSRDAWNGIVCDGANIGESGNIYDIGMQRSFAREQLADGSWCWTERSAATTEN